MGRMTAWAVVLAIGCGAGAFMTACGGGGGGGGSSEPSVAVFTNTEYVDYDVNNNEAEASNVMKTLEHLGIEAVAFTGITAEAFGSALAGRMVLAFPEIDPFKNKLAPDLGPEAVAVISGFVQGGGTLLLFSGERVNAAIAETTFGWYIHLGTEVGTTIDIRAAQTAGTSFEGGPPTLSYPSQVTSYGADPGIAGAMAMYADTQFKTSCVTVIPAGSGQVIHLGWDWDWIGWAEPNTPISEGNDGGWFEVLDRAVRY